MVLVVTLPQTSLALSIISMNPDAVANILSQSAEKGNGATIHYDNNKDEYTMSFDNDASYIPLTFIRVGGLYCVNTTNMDESYYAMHNHHSTVKANRLKYTKREVKRADEAMKLRRRLSCIPRRRNHHQVPIYN